MLPTALNSEFSPWATQSPTASNIDQILDKAVLSVANFRPNIIIVHAGTNDMNSNPPIDPDHAPERLGKLIDNIISFGNQDSVILVAQIINTSNAQTQSLIQKYNDAIPGVVAKRSNHHIGVVDFSNKLQPSDYADGLHPNDSGYKKMADIWFNAIQDAAHKGWIKAPQGPPPNLVGPNGLARKPGSPIASGVGENGAAKWTAHYDPHWPKAASGIGKPGNGTVFADLTGVFLSKESDVDEKTGSVILYQNTGVGDEISWNPVNDGKEIASGVAPRELIRFVDIDTDGKDDYVVLGKETGSVTVYLNGGPKAGAPGDWVWDGPHDVAPGAPGAKATNVLFADVNGRPDYLVKNSNGGLDAYLNIGQRKTIDGDGRADYLQWASDNKGGLTGYLNYRTEKEGQPGWASTRGMGSVAGGTGRSSTWSKLADFNGDASETMLAVVTRLMVQQGKADYAILGDKGELDVYINKGTADTSVIGDSVRLADLNGDGLDDYVVLGANAGVRLYTNNGLQSDGQHWNWVPINNFEEIATGAGAKREMIHFADMDGDGMQDFNIVEPKSGAIVLYKNGGQQPDGKWTWIPALGGKPIATGLGPGELIRLADLDGTYTPGGLLWHLLTSREKGDGKADYILLGAERGDAVLYLNKGEKPGGWSWIPYNDGKPIATGIGFIADHVQFFDIDGDGLADYLGIDQLSGATTVYRNLGPQPNGGWGWVPMNDAKPIATGIGSVGRDVLWGRMEKTNRYSYLGIAPNSGALRSYLNSCNEFSPSVDPSGPSDQGNPNSGGSGSGQGNPDSGGSGSGQGNSNSGGSGSGQGNPNSGGSGSGQGSSNPGGSSGSGSDGESNNDNSPGSYVNGGKPIPDGGDLGLETEGEAAISGMTPYARTTRNDLNTARTAINSLKAGNPTSAGVDAAVGALSTLASDYSALSNQAKKWVLDSFDEDLRSSARKEQADLESARQQVSDLIPQLRACSVSVEQSQQSSTECRQVYDQASAVLSGSNVLVPLAWFESRNGGNGGSSSSSGGGDESSNGSNNSNNGGCGGLNFLGGALPIPSGGLGGLGLPLTPIDQAITAMKPFAIAAQNALAFASDLACSLGDSSSASEISDAANALDTAGSNLSALSSQLDAIEMQSLTSGQAATLQTELTNLRTASEIVSGLSTRLKGAINTAGFRAAALVVATLATEQYVLQSLFFFTRPDNPLAPGAITPPMLSPPDYTKPQEWYINTVPGTSVKDFQAWIKTLPDKGLGRQHIYGGANFQSYVGKWTEEESIIIHENPIVSHQIPNVRLQVSWNFLQEDIPAVLEDNLRRRAGNAEILQNRGIHHLNILSLPKNKDISSLKIPNEDLLYHYMYEASAGSGTFVYVFDGGVNWNHLEFEGVPHEDYIVPTLKGKDGKSVTDFGDQNDGHGTGVTSSIVGKYYGVAKRVTVVSVKMSAGADLVAEDILEAWRWAVEDVRARDREGKAVFVLTTGQFCASNTFDCLITLPHPATANPTVRRNTAHAEYAYRAPYNIPRPAKADPWVDLLAEAWQTGIVTVFAAGNKGAPGEVDQIGGTNPQRFATSNNPMIIVGGIDNRGSKSRFNREVGAPPGSPGLSIDAALVGELTTYANGEGIPVASHETNTNARVMSGTSFAAPQIGGLAAYFLGLPNLIGPSDFAAIPMAIKKHIRKTARDDVHDGVGTAYNGVRELPCNQWVTTLQQKKRRAVEDAISLADKMYDLLGGNLTVPESVLKIPGSVTLHGEE
ncbi:MAG: hypothetical protein Q9178_005301 [Gyalolechia marmorata]